MNPLSHCACYADVLLKANNNYTFVSKTVNNQSFLAK